MCTGEPVAELDDGGALEVVGVDGAGVRGAVEVTEPLVFGSPRGVCGRAQALNVRPPARIVAATAVNRRVLVPTLMLAPFCCSGLSCLVAHAAPEVAFQ